MLNPCHINNAQLVLCKYNTDLSILDENTLKYAYYYYYGTNIILSLEDKN